MPRLPLSDDNDTRPNRRLSGIEDAARLSLGDFDGPDMSASTQPAGLPSIQSLAALAFAYLALIVAWLGT